MTEDEVQREVLRIAVSEIGKKHIAAASVKPDTDFDGGEALEVLIVLKPDAPSVSGKTYTSILLKSYDFLHEQNDRRRPSITLERTQTSAATAK